MNDYMQDISAICGILNIPVPRLTLDQVVLKQLLKDINTAVATYDPLPTGDAVAADVVVGKTFSNATGTGLTGTLVYTALPVPAAVVIPADKKISFAMAPLFADYFDAITVYEDGVSLGDAAFAEPSGYTFDLSALATLTGAYHYTAKYVAKDTVTLSDSAAVAIDFNLYAIMRTLVGCTDSNVSPNTFEGAAVTGTLTLTEGFNSLPAAITVTIGGVAAVLDTDYTYVPGTGVYNIAATSVTGTIEISATATA